VRHDRWEDARLPEKKPTGPVAGTAATPNVLDDAVAPTYTNFCRINATPEEVILDFALNAEPTASAPTIRVANRIVCNYYTAKRLFLHLGMAIERHEAAFGPIEVDVAKRLKTG
jgi:hypothetical protein